MFKLGRIIAIIFSLIIAYNAIAQGQASASPSIKQKQNARNDIIINQYPFKTTIEVPREKEVGVAAFIKGNKLWVILNSYKKFNFGNIRLGQDKSLLAKKIYWVESIEQLRLSSDQTYLVFSLAGLFSKTPVLNASKGDNNWIFEIYDQNLQHNQEISVVSKPFATPFPRVELGIDEEVNCIDFIDPYIGDSMLVIPVKNPKKSISKKYDFVDFNIIPSAQGIVIRRLSDTVSYDISGDKLYIGSSEMVLSTKIVLPKQSTKPHKHKVEKSLEFTEYGNGIINFNLFRVKDEDFNYENYKITQALQDFSKEERAKIYTNLALLYLANGLYKEARVIIKIIKQLDNNFAYYYKIRLISAIAAFMDMDYNDAFESISSIDISNIPINSRREIRFWQGVISYVSGKANNEYFISNDIGNSFNNIHLDFLAGYTPHITLKLAEAVINNEIESKEYKVAEQVLKIALQIDVENQQLENRILYIAAKYYLLRQQDKIAEEYLDKCMSDILDTLNRTLCRFIKVKHQLEHKKITSQQAIDELEELTYVWRGDQLEIEMLDYLGNLYNQQNESGNALKTWNKIVKYYPNSMDALLVHKSMIDTFIKFFLNKQDENMSTLEALAVFYEFKYLTPIGDIGDKIMVKFADYLAKLDLLDRATAILNHQVANRLTGLMKEEVINKLAKLHILNGKPQIALEVLDLGGKEFPLANDLAQERMHIRADALYLIHHYNEALELLKNDYTQKSDDIKANIYWDLQNWGEFNNYSEPYLYSIVNDSRQLTAQEVKRVLKQAVSYIITNRKDLLQELYKNFKGRMPPSKPYTNVLELLCESLLTKPGNNIIGAQDIENYKAIINNLVNA